MDINYELYKVFYYVATTLSFSEASRQLYISQSAVSQSVKVLEKKLGKQLFLRSTKKVQLTPEGEILLRHVEPAMNLIMRGRIPAAGRQSPKRRTAAHRCQRYHLPAFSHSLSEPFPPGAPEHPYQSDQLHLHRLCGSAGKRAGRPHRRQLSQFPAHQSCPPETTANLSRRICGQPPVLRSGECLPVTERPAELPDPDAGSKKHHQRISASAVSAAPAGSGAGDRTEQQRPATGSGQHRPRHCLCPGLLPGRQKPGSVPPEHPGRTARQASSFWPIRSRFPCPKPPRNSSVISDSVPEAANRICNRLPGTYGIFLPFCREGSLIDAL